MFAYVKVLVAAYALGAAVTYLALEVGVPDANAGWAGTGISLFVGLLYIRRLLRKGAIKMRETDGEADVAKEEKERERWVDRDWHGHAVSFAVFAISAQCLASLRLGALLVFFAAVVAATWARIRWERTVPLGDEPDA